MLKYPNYLTVYHTKWKWCCHWPGRFLWTLWEPHAPPSSSVVPIWKSWADEGSAASSAAEHQTQEGRREAANTKRSDSPTEHIRWGKNDSGREIKTRWYVNVVFMLKLTWWWRGSVISPPLKRVLGYKSQIRRILWHFSQDRWRCPWLLQSLWWQLWVWRTDRRP